METCLTGLLLHGLPCSLTEARLPCDDRSTIKALVKVMNSWTLQQEPQQSLLEEYIQAQHTKPMFCLVVENHTWSAERSRRRWARRPLWGDWLWWLLCEWCWDCRASWCNAIRSGHSGLNRRDHTTPITCSKRTHRHNHMTALARSLSHPTRIHYLQVIRRQRQLVWSSANDH